MRKVIVTTAALVTQGAAESTHCEVLPFPEGRLSARERDVLAMISQGLSNKRIARAREISPETVKSHVKHIFLKLAVTTRAQAVFQAGSLGLLRGGNFRQEEARRSAIECARRAGKTTTYSPPQPKAAVSRSNFLRLAAILCSAIVAIGCAGPVSADPLSVGARSPAAEASGEDTLARCEQLFGLWSRHNTDGYARPLDARMELENCRKGNVASGVAALKRALERAQIPIPPTESGVAQTPAPLKPHGEQRRLSQ